MIDESAKLRGNVKISICIGDECHTEILECNGKFTVAEVGTVVQRHAYQLLIESLEAAANTARDKKNPGSKPSTPNKA